jgi:hypothetical protein
MSTMDDVRAAEQKILRILDELKKACSPDVDRLYTELDNAFDEHTKAVDGLFLKQRGRIKQP